MIFVYEYKNGELCKYRCKENKGGSINWRTKSATTTTKIGKRYLSFRLSKNEGAILGWTLWLEEEDDSKAAKIFAEHARSQVETLNKRVKNLKKTIKQLEGGLK